MSGLWILALAVLVLLVGLSIYFRHASGRRYEQIVLDQRRSFRLTVAASFLKDARQGRTTPSEAMKKLLWAVQSGAAMDQILSKSGMTATEMIELIDRVHPYHPAGFASQVQQIRDQLIQKILPEEARS